MAITVAQLADQGNMSLDGTPTSVVDITLDTSYPTGGYLAASGLTAANLNCGRGINGMSWIGNNAAAVGYVPEFNTDYRSLGDPFWGVGASGWRYRPQHAFVPVPGHRPALKRSSSGRT